MGVVYQAVQDGVSKCCIPNGGMPMFNRNLAGHDRGTHTMAVVQDFEQVTSMRIVEHRKTPVIDH